MSGALASEPGLTVTQPPISATSFSTSSVDETAEARTAIAIVQSRSTLELLYASSRDEKAQYIDCFDKALGVLSTTERKWRFKIIRVLRKLCSETGSFPKSLMLPSSELSAEGPPRDYGGFADVWLGKHKNQDVAMKVVRVGQENREMLRKVGLSGIQSVVVYRSLQLVIKEAICWKYLVHPNIVPFFGVEESDTRLCMVSLWMHNGNLPRYLKSNSLADCDRLKLVSSHMLHFAYGVT